VCGITGLVALDDRLSIDITLLDQMTDSLAHRGPDGRGTYIDENVGFGHRRLAIIDPEKGVQPWVDNTRGFALTYNGELYNYLELKEILSSYNVEFKTDCDTEVVFQALIHWGVEEALDRFRGMFALAFWEKGPKRLTLARDPMGVKPLYWSMRGGMVRFGSEMKTILRDPTFPREVDPVTLNNYLAHYRLSFQSKSLFKNISEVPAGSYIQWEKKRKREVKYWSVPRIPESEKVDMGEEKSAEEFVAQLSKAVEKRLMADVPLGAYLSGGIDSAVLVSLMKKLGKEDILTYSIGFEEDGYNEFEYSRAMANHLGVNHHEVTLTEEGYFNQFESLVGIKDTPLSVPNEIPLRFLSKHLKHKLTVVLSGEGADELLGGYSLLVRSPHDYMLSQHLQTNPSSFTDMDAQRLKNSLTGLYGDWKIDSQKDQFLRLYQWMPRQQRQSFFNKEMTALNLENRIDNFWDSKWSELESAGLSPYDKVLQILEEVHLSALIKRLDATTMAEGVEGRVPYTDRDLIEWASALPLKYKLRWLNEDAEKQSQKMTALEVAGQKDIGKYILRLAFAGNIPDKILLRPKAAFPVPVDRWFYGSKLQWAKERILTPKMASLFDLKQLENLMDTSRGKDEGMKIWMLANIGIWLEMYFGSRSHVV